MCTSQKGWTIAALAGLLFLQGRSAVPHFVDENGKPFKLHFRPLRMDSSPTALPRSSRLSVVPASPWSIPEVVSGRTEPEGSVLFHQEAERQEPSYPLDDCGFSTTTGNVDCEF